MGSTGRRLKSLDSARAIIVLALLYALAGRLGLILAVPPGYATAFFPSAGIALAAVVTGGPRMLIGVALGAFGLNLLLPIQSGATTSTDVVSAAVLITGASVLQAWIGSVLIRRWVRPSLDTARDVLLFLAAAPLMCLISAGISVPSLYFLHIVAADMVPTNWVTWWIGDAIGVLLGAPMAWIAIGEPRRLWLRRRWLLVLPLCASSAVFIVIYCMASRWETNQQMLGFRLKSQQAADMLQNQFSEHERLLYTLASVFDQQGQALSAQEFHSAAHVYLAQRPELRSMFWLPRVGAAERAQFELWAQKQIAPDYAIHQLGKDGSAVTVTNQPAYYPIAYLEPMIDNRRALGLDLLADPPRAEALRRTVEHRRVSASEPVLLRIHPRDERKSIFLMQAVSAQDGVAPRGVLGVVLQVEPYVQRVLRQVGASEFLVKFEDATMPARQTSFFDTLGREAQPDDYQRRLELGGRSYLVSFAPSASYLALHRSWQSWATLAGGLILTGLLGAFLLLMSGQRLQIERVVIDRTRKLQEREAKLVAILDKAVDAILTIDRDGALVSVNGAAGKLFGYALHEMHGMPFHRLIQTGNEIRSTVILEQLAKHLRADEEFVGRYADGRTFPLSIAVSLVEVTNETFFVCILRDLSEQHRAQEKIYQLAHHDPLTGLANRFTLNLQLQKLLGSARSDGKPLALMFIDLDYFKKINDTQGHHVGDQLLVDAAARLIQLLPDAAVIARLGNDEFIVVFYDNVAPEQLGDTAQRIIDVLRQPFEIDGQRYQSGGSIGVSRYPGDGDDPDTLLRNADAAVMAAKQQGRGKYQFFTAELNAAAQERLQMENRIWLALERKEFEIYLQPQVHLSSRKIIGAEVLLRWKHPEVGFIPPDRFIPIAEESGLILPLGEWVLERALRLLAGWQHMKMPPLRLAVNLSARQCHSGSLLTCLDRLQQETRVDLRALEMEITETAAMQDPEQTRELLRQLRLRGIKVAIDDFGTGYSSLNYLKLFEIDRIKIDRSFVKDIEKDENDALIASATIALGHTLGLEVIAEGVETEAQCSFLNHELCDEGQGYLFGKPMPVPEFEALLDSSNSASANYA
jgi:diguanylate cyclase (GGDEF)-like protein/PAS domain S-box-containing protein